MVFYSKLMGGTGFHLKFVGEWVLAEERRSSGFGFEFGGGHDFSLKNDGETFLIGK